MQGQSLANFIKILKKIANKLTVNEQDLKDTFVHPLLPIFKLQVQDHDDIYFGKMIEKLLCKESCIL